MVKPLTLIRARQLRSWPTSLSRASVTAAMRSQPCSKNRRAERELYEILLGWRFGPQITMLENELYTEQEEHKKDILKLSQQILDMQTQVSDLEQQVEHLNVEHGIQGEDLEQANETIKELEQALSHMAQERLALRNRLEQTVKEKDAIQARHDEWRHYAEQLEQGLNRPQSPKKK
jgi:chromosome segregation ATPase